LHDQIHGDGIHDYISTTAHAAIDAGADVFLCNGGTPRGVEIYKGKAIIHGQQPFCFQNTQVRHVPPTVIERKRLPPGSTAAEMVADRARGHTRSSQAGGLGAHFNEGTAVALHAVVFDANGELSEVRAYPMERLGGSRHGIPSLLEPGSEKFNRVLELTHERCERIGTSFEARDAYGVVEVKA
jgi:hypothetical protein